MLKALEEVLTRAKALRKILRAESLKTVGKLSIRTEAKELGTVWHREVLPLLDSNLTPEALERYGSCFTRLIRLSTPNNRVASYLEALDGIIKSYNDDILLPAQQGRFAAASASEFDKFFSSFVNGEETEYLKEAIACAKAGFLRAAVVLGWSAAIDRTHRRIEQIGFKHFNVVSAQLASQQSGRYKKFNQTQNVGSISEIRDVFDNVILWIVEGMALIDSNQHTRLKSCFDMRCQCAHPGEAPVTTYNLLSFFSDLEQIVFSNPKFKIL